MNVFTLIYNINCRDYLENIVNKLRLKDCEIKQQNIIKINNEIIIMKYFLIYE